MSQDTAEAVDPTTDADEEALDRALAAGRSAAATGPHESTSASQPARGPAAYPSDGRPARRQPDSE
ncbi:MULTISPECIES: hypothetical protein [Streptomyces]|uniref:Uncharacterized protein n=1 Tax=Streptomyces katrae TaxID=68223 RepID=A0ABT7H529_9ACTN|nr:MULTISPECIES: hypothetical protein [Streptomyces]MDK9500994.1 hypothetical protein [Streptomyces katrae]RST02118.1 hypothetical protein EF910_24815 [Streptomyces sp. WAC07149]GLX18475.1 hypothetical protein Slala01_21190 [Streptomyces lavendulae subsp. lavendulae]GLX28600.1 hypothetical protein Slala02_44200 [Streptomyces lavendulae subsp. lavendulae]